MGTHLRLDIRTSYLYSSPMVVVRNGKNEKNAGNNPFIASIFFRISFSEIFEELLAINIVLLAIPEKYQKMKF